MRVGRRVLRHSDSSSGCISCKCKFPCQVRQRLSVTTRFPRFSRLVPRRKSAYGTFQASFAIPERGSSENPSPRAFRRTRSGNSRNHACAHVRKPRNQSHTAAIERTRWPSKRRYRRYAICRSWCTFRTLHRRSSRMVEDERILREFRTGISRDSLRSYIRPEWQKWLPGDYCNCEWTVLQYFRGHWYSSRSTQL